jgi:hypothetical protein
MNRIGKMGIGSKYAKCAVIFVMAFVVTQVSTSQASESASSVSAAVQAINAALDSRDLAMSEISDDQIHHTAQDTANMVIDEALLALRNEGYHSEADQYERRWNADFANFFLRRPMFDLGDHGPLLSWLARFHQVLEATIGSKKAHMGILGDLYDLNYAIPVVFAPNGEWRTRSTRRDTTEYREHFVPFTNVVTYWTTRLTCEQVMRAKGAAKQGRKLCPFIAGKLSMVSDRFLAPKLSDYVFARANGADATLDISEEDLVYLNAGELLEEFEARQN